VHIKNSNFQNQTAPELGNDTNSVLEEAGFTIEQINKFKSDGII
jgi:crotonobetainyl-CoA:carnitine CoA-transferase CaiB-like acyl-CoA transferase